MAPIPATARAGDARAIVAIAARQFGTRFSTWLREHLDGIHVEHSRKTGKIRYVRAVETLLLVLRPVDGFFSLSVDGARVLATLEREVMENGIVVLDEVAEFIKKGKNVFAKHVVNAPMTLRPSQEVYVTDGHGTVLAVGKSVLSGRDMMHFDRGVAVKVRHGAGDADSAANHQDA